MKKILVVIAFSCFVSHQLEAQLLKRVMKRTQDKLEQKVEDKVVERISDELARAAMRPVDKAIDQMLAERYEQDSISGKTTGSYDDFLTAFLQPVDLPASYSFDMTLDIETKDYDGNKSEMQMLCRKDGKLIGFIQNEDQTYGKMIFDVENDIMVMYQEGKEKKVTAIPSMLSMASSMNSMKSTQNSMKSDKKSSDNPDAVSNDVVMTKTGKKKKILGYQCDEIKFEDEQTTGQGYIANSFPVTWKEMYGPFIKSVLPAQKDEFLDGMILKSESKLKSNKKKFKYEVKKVDMTPLSIDNKSYEQVAFESYQ